MFISSYSKQASQGEHKAEIHQKDGGYSVIYYSPDGTKLNEESFGEKQLEEASSSAATWINGIENLYG